MNLKNAESKEVNMTTTYVLYIQFADDPPRVMVFGSFNEAETYLDVFEVQVFDPPANDELLELPYRARIFECKDVGWGTEVDIGATRKKMLQAAATVEFKDLLKPSAGENTVPPILLKPPATDQTTSGH